MPNNENNDMSPLQLLFMLAVLLTLFFTAACSFVHARAEYQMRHPEEVSTGE